MLVLGLFLASASACFLRLNYCHLISRLASAFVVDRLVSLSEFGLGLPGHWPETCMRALLCKYEMSASSLQSFTCKYEMAVFVKAGQGA